MSDKLTRLDINNNVELYPCITEQKRKELFERCDIYHNVKSIQKLILDGAYTRKTLQDAIIEVLENACTPVENRYQDHI